MSVTNTVTKIAGAALSAGVATARQGLNLVQRLRPARPKREMDDATLKAKVESTIFRESGAAKDKVSVTVVDGVVELRGEVRRPEDIRELEARARAVPEVRDVQSLMHLRRTAPRRQTTSRAKTTAASKPRTGRRRTTGESQRAAKPAAAGEKAEKTPLQKAAAGEGRTAAPMGSTD